MANEDHLHLQYTQYVYFILVLTIRLLNIKYIGRVILNGAI